MALLLLANGFESGVQSRFAHLSTGPARFY